MGLSSVMLGLQCTQHPLIVISEVDIRFSRWVWSHEHIALPISVAIMQCNSAVLAS
jgi:hypothetical protein